MYWKKMFISLTFLTISISFLFGCTLIQKGHTIDATKSPTISSTTISLSAAEVVTFVSNPEYMKECKMINPDNHKGQISYLGIYPGQSTSEDVLKHLDRPTETNYFSNDEEWVYKGFNINIEEDVVESIDVYGDPQLVVSLKELIIQYGCPDLILAVDDSIEQPNGSYSLAHFIYIGNGIDFIISGFPVSLTDVPYSVGFFIPQSLEDYLNRSDYINFGPKVENVVSWREAVK